MKIRQYGYIFFAAIILFCALSVKTASAASGTCGDNLTWSFSSDKVLRISGTGDMYNYSAYAPWYSYYSYYTSVVIEDGVTSIGDRAFANDMYITDITIADSVTKIGSKAFYCCYKLNKVYLSSSLTTVETSAFSFCPCLKSAGPKDSGCNIEYNWAGEIPQGAFNCSTLTSITIGSGIYSISERAFDNCESVAEYLVQDGNNYFSAEDGVLYNKAKTKLVKFPYAKDWDSYEIPDSVTSIEEYAVYEYAYYTVEDNFTDGLFYFKNWLLKAYKGFSGSCELADNTAGIGDWAFFQCDDMTDITIPGSVNKISNFAFFYCTGLNSVNIENGVTGIGSQALSYCTSLAEITIPESVTSIGTLAFSGSSLTSATILSREAAIKSYAFTYCDSLEYVYCYKGSTADNADLYPEGVTIIYLDEAETEKGSGDINGDGNTDNIDAALILKDLSTLVSLTEEQKAAADVNGDGTVDILDTIEIIKSL
ncbi:MAG: leucine-rich repeat protein [Clostridiales bacterium]|nr:leucine-rich repeat protein [Clostridiales bacterium]